MKFRNSIEFLLNMKHLESSPRHPKQRGAACLGLGHSGDARATAETTLKVEITEETWQILSSFRRYKVWKENLKQKSWQAEYSGSLLADAA